MKDLYECGADPVAIGTLATRGSAATVLARENGLALEALASFPVRCGSRRSVRCAPLACRSPMKSVDLSTRVAAPNSVREDGRAMASSRRDSGPPTRVRRHRGSASDLSGQASRPAAASAQPSPVVIRGRVVADDNNRPLRRAVVMLALGDPSRVPY